MENFKCLNCHIGHEIMKNYKQIHNKSFDKVDEKILKEMSQKLWGTTYSFEDNCKKEELLEAFIALSKLTYEYKPQKHENVDKTLLEDLDNCMCLENLRPIIFALRAFYGDENTDILGKHTNLISVLNEMNELNKLVPTYKYEQAKKIIRMFSKYNSNDNADNDKKRENLIIGLKYIYNKYSKFPLPENAIHTPAQCFNATVSEITPELHSLQKIEKENKQFIERTNNLSKQYTIIMQEYLRNALKNIGTNINYIMELQGMTEQDVAQLLNIAPRKIQALRTQKSITKNQDFIKLLSRGLLVSESLIYTGYGQKFGNWNNMLKGETLTEIQNNLQKGKRETIAYIRNILHDYIKSEENLKNIKKEFPDFFKTEEIRVYSSLEDCFENLLHKEDAYTLLEVLEKLDNPYNKVV